MHTGTKQTQTNTRHRFWKQFPKLLYGEAVVATAAAVLEQIKQKLHRRMRII
jgi:hypothetical protein